MEGRIFACRFTKAKVCRDEDESRRCIRTSTPLEIVDLSSGLGVARSIRTSAGGDMLGRHDISGVVEWCLQALNLDGLLTGSFPLDRVNQAIIEMRDGRPFVI